MANTTYRRNRLVRIVSESVVIIVGSMAAGKQSSRHHSGAVADSSYLETKTTGGRDSQREREREGGF